MHTLNGFTIIAYRFSGDSFIVMGVRHDKYVNGFEYVTAHMRELTEKEWFWGHYSHDFEKSVEDYTTR